MHNPYNVVTFIFVLFSIFASYYLVVWKFDSSKPKSLLQLLLLLVMLFLLGAKISAGFVPLFSPAAQLVVMFLYPFAALVGMFHSLLFKSSVRDYQRHKTATPSRKLRPVYEDESHHYYSNQRLRVEDFEEDAPTRKPPTQSSK